MSIERSQSTQSDNAAREAERTRERPRDKPREKPKAEEVDRFRTLMQSQPGQRKEGQELRLTARDGQALPAEGEQAETATATETAVHGKRGDEGDESSGQDGGGRPGGEGLRPSELAALYQAQMAAREVPTTPPAAAPQAHANPQALADMLERHVRQLAVSQDGTEQEKGQVLLRLNDATLPGTDLLLSRTERGWLLRADVRSRGSYEAIQHAAPKLAERFASRNLGMLEVDSHYSA